MGARIAKIDQTPELKDVLAEAYAEGATQEKLCEVMGVSDRGTIATWLKRPDIQAKITKAVQERSNRIIRHTTASIEAMLFSGKKISLENLLKIHREFAGSNVNLNVNADDATALQELFLAAHDDPDIAAAIQTLKGESADAPEA